MAMKEQQRQLHRSANGKVVDMNKLAMQNETTVAVGNIRVNARGDLLGPGGTIIKTHEEVVSETKQGVPATAVKARKDVSNMDPEGKE
jgi:hypothetical protein